MGVSGKTYCLGLCFSCCILVGLGFIAAGVVLYLEFPSIMEQQVDQKVTIQPGHATYEQLQEPTLPVWKSFTFFNLTNPEDFQNGEKAQVEEVGPYSYSESRVKHFMKSTSSNQLKYTQTKLFFFDRNTTADGLSETDTICTINLALVTAVAQVESISNTVERFAGRELMKHVIFSDSNAKLYICQPATDLAWHYTDNLVHRLHTNTVLKSLKMNYPSEYVSIQVNNSANDTKPSVILTGVDNITMLGEYIQWDGHEDSVNIWPGETANHINGTEGLFFHPNLKEGEPLQVFKDDVVRSFQLVYSEKVDHLGLQAFRYKLINTTFQSATTYPGNARWGPSGPDGLINLAPTQWPVVPVFGSKPHYLDGDPRLREQVSGMPQPNRTEDDTDIDVEPITGALVTLRQQLQVNIQVNRTDTYKQLKNVKGFSGTDTLYYPVLYVNEHAELTPDFKQYLESKGLSEVFLFQKLVPAILGVLAFVGLVCLIISLVVCVSFVKRARRDTSPENQPLLTN